MADPDHAAHKAIERYEQFWIAFSLVLLVIFVVLVFHAVAMHGGQVGKAAAREAPETILARPEFADPSVRRRDDGTYEASIVAQAFSFQPAVVEVPADAEVTFRLTSRDVIHGFQIMGTNINVELIPGEIAELRHTFGETGDYPLICNQYCGIAHHNMINMVRVVDEADLEVAEATDEPAEAVAPEEGEPAWEVRGERVYGSQCAACHQADGSGRRGAFPPLAGHAVDLLTANRGRAYLIDVILYGLGGPITVDGERYSGVMPGLGRLSDEDVAAAVNHMLHAWGNAERLPADFEPVTAAEVAERRGRDFAPRDMLNRRPAVD